MPETPKKENYQAVAAEAVKNQPAPDVHETSENAQIMDSPAPDAEQASVETENFNVSAKHFVGVGVEMFANGWRFAFGTSEGAELKEEEKEEYRSLFSRACEHYGLDKEVTGTKGFILELLGLVISSVFPRLANSETRDHFNKNVLQKEQNDNGQLDSTTNDREQHSASASNDAINTGEQVYTIQEGQPA